MNAAPSAPPSAGPGRGRPALALLLAGAFATAFAPWLRESHSAGPLTIALAGLLLLPPLLAILVGARAAGEGAVGVRGAWLLAIVCAAAFLAFAEVERAWSPPLISSEARQALVQARNWCEAVDDAQRAQVARYGLATYNLGFAPFFIPVVAAFGPDPAAYHRATIALFALCVGTLLATFARWAGRRDLPLPLPLLLLPLGALAMFLPSLRTLKWHAASLVAGLALLGLAAVWAEPRAHVRRAACLLLLLGAVVLYHLNVVFLLLALLLPLHQALRRRPLARVSLALFVLALAAAAWLLAWSAQVGHSALLGRVGVETAHAATVWNSTAAYDLLRRHLEVPMRLFAAPTLALLLLGVGVALRRGWREPATGLALLAMGLPLAMNLRFSNFGDPAWFSWMLVPLLWLIAVGLQETAVIVGALLPRTLAPSVLLLGLVGISAAEWTHFRRAQVGEWYQLTPLPHVLAAQFAGAVRAVQTTPPAPDTLVLLPDPLLAYEQGGFQHEVPLEELDPAARLWNLREFRDGARLASLQRAIREGHPRWARSVMFLPAPASPKADPLPPALQYLRELGARIATVPVPGRPGGPVILVTRVQVDRRP